MNNSTPDQKPSIVLQATLIASFIICGFANSQGYTILVNKGIEYRMYQLFIILICISPAILLYAKVRTILTEAKKKTKPNHIKTFVENNSIILLLIAFLFIQTISGFVDSYTISKQKRLFITQSELTAKGRSHGSCKFTTRFKLANQKISFWVSKTEYDNHEIGDEIDVVYYVNVDGSLLLRK